METNLFQFYDSAIKSVEEAKQMGQFSTFQFYDSAIKSRFRFVLAFCPSMFQFYDSAIKSHQTKKRNIFRFRFNSTIVRLKEFNNAKAMRRIFVSILR